MDIPQSVLDAQDAFDMTRNNGIDMMDQNCTLQIVPATDEAGQVIRSEDGKAAFYIRFYGGPEVQVNFSMFVNHKRVDINGAEK